MKYMIGIFLRGLEYNLKEYLHLCNGRLYKFDIYGISRLLLLTIIEGCFTKMVDVLFYRM